VLFVVVPALASASCGGSDGELILGATTSVQDAGLLDALVAGFEAEHPYAVKPIVQGSGQVMELARKGELDVAMTHSQAAEQGAIEEGFVAERIPFMQNYFLLVGPTDDSAGVGASMAISDALERIAAVGATFASRGDASGTHVREMEYWDEAGINPVGQPWYRETAAGQGQTLLYADDEDAYTLVDSSTFVSFGERVGLAEHVRDVGRPNVYSLLRLDAEAANQEAAEAWIGFVASAGGQRVIAEFGQGDQGVPLFEALLLN
jgi:tungstate transport system substrate-binding protein